MRHHLLKEYYQETINYFNKKQENFIYLENLDYECFRKKNAEIITRAEEKF